MKEISPFSFYLTLLLGGTILVGIFIITVLVKSKSIGRSRYFLAAILFFLLLHLNTFLLFITEIVKDYPNLLGISYPGLFLIGPLYYFFVKSYNNNSFKFRFADLFHSVPFIISLLMQLPFYFKDNVEKFEIINFYYNNVPTGDIQVVDWLISNVFMILILLYSFFSLSLILKRNYKNGVVFQKITFVLIILALGHLIVQTEFLITGKSAIIAEMILASFFAIVILLLSYWVVDIKSVFLLSHRYKTSPVSIEDSEIIKSKLVDVLENGELYLKSGLKIRDLSNVTNIPSHHISQVLNEQMKISFHDLINKYRIDKAQQLLGEGATQKLSIEAIGTICGFTNKSSFYRAFKKNTGKTPTEFMKFSHIKGYK